MLPMPSVPTHVIKIAGCPPSQGSLGSTNVSETLGDISRTTLQNLKWDLPARGPFECFAYLLHR